MLKYEGSEGTLNLLAMLRAAVKAVPAVRYALGVLGIAAVVAIVIGFRIKPQYAVFGTLITVGLMFLLLIFAGAAAKPGRGSQRHAASVLIWFFTLSTVVVVSLLIVRWFFPPSDPIEHGHAIVLNGYQAWSQSTFIFSSGELSHWQSDQADIGVFRSAQMPEPHFFLMSSEASSGLQQNEPPGMAGIIDMNRNDLDAVRRAPESGYVGGNYAPMLHHVYCVRTRDGRHFAKIKVTDVQQDRISFDYAYQPKQSSNLSD